MKQSRKHIVKCTFHSTSLKNTQEKLFKTLFGSVRHNTVILPNIGKLYYNYSLSTKRYHVVSYSLFIMQHMYKSANKYVNGAYQIAKHFKKYFPKFVLRVYFDVSLFHHKQTYKYLEWMHNMGHQLVMYDCPRFKLNSRHHQGTFGTLMRYLPYFKHLRNDAKCCFVIDADYYSDNVNKLKCTLQLYGQKIRQLIASRAHFFRYQWVACINENRIQWVIEPSDFVAGSFNACTMQFPMHLLSDFLLRDVYAIANTYPTLYKSCIQYKKKNHPIFWYGIDEFFLSNVLKVYLDKHNIPYMTHYTFKRLDWILHTMLLNKKVKQNNHKILQHLLQLFNAHFETSFETIDKVLEHIGKEYDFKRKTNKHKMYLFLRKEILKLYTDNLIQLQKNHQKCLLSMDTYLDDTNNLKISS